MNLTATCFEGDIHLATLLDVSDYQGEMLVCAPKLRKAFERIQRIAPYKVTVLIHGESGTGKELVANALHRLGPTPLGPFVALNCANLVGQLAESQLFGHIRGAFTDARDNSLGYFRAAQGGTLFLDEIGELPLALQAKILRAVENREIQPVGSYQVTSVDLRLVAATNRNLRAMVAAGTFREDLFHRLNAISVATPPLRECREAIGALAAHFINSHSRTAEKCVTHISGAALRVLMSYNWPGNVRELGHAMQNAVLMADDYRIDLPDLPSHLLAGHNSSDAGSEIDAPDICDTAMLEEPEDAQAYQSATALDALTKTALLRSLERTHGNRQQAAKILGISRQKLYRMIARYELSEAGRRPHP